MRIPQQARPLQIRRLLRLLDNVLGNLLLERSRCYLSMRPAPLRLALEMVVLHPIAKHQVEVEGQDGQPATGGRKGGAQEAEETQQPARLR